MTESILNLIREAEEACRRSLYDDIAIGMQCDSIQKTFQSVKQNGDRQQSKRQRIDDSSIPQKQAPRTWQELLAAAAKHLPSMTEREHGKIMRIASIFLLGFLLPHSTGHDFGLLQNLSNKHTQTWKTSSFEDADSSDVTMERLIQMPMSERLDNACRKMNAGEYGELGTIAEGQFELAFNEFVEKGLIPLLSCRPVHTIEVDVLHLVAACIDPEPSEQFVLKTVTLLEENESKAWIYTRDMMNKLVNHNLQLNYSARSKLVKMVADNLHIPHYHEDTTFDIGPLFEGALVHLRASLHAFALNALTPYDCHYATCANVSIAVQCGINETFDQEWHTLLHQMVDDRAKCKCSTSNTCEDRMMFSFSLMSQAPTSFCVHAARGKLLGKLFTRFHRSRKSFTQTHLVSKCLSSLADAVEWQIDGWTKMEETDSTLDSPCMLASLLHAAGHIMVFSRRLLGSQDEKLQIESCEEKSRINVLMDCCVELLCHWDFRVANEASILLAHTVVSADDNRLKSRFGYLLRSTKQATLRHLNKVPFESNRNCLPIEEVTAAACSKSNEFSDSFLSFLLSLDFGVNEARFTIVARTIAVVANATPSTSVKYSKEVVALVQGKDCPQNAKRHLLAALMTCRLVGCGKEEDIEHVIFATTSNGWHSYQLFVNAIVTGNFYIANLIYKRLAALPLPEVYVLWLSVLNCISSAESRLSTGTSKNLSEASNELSKAASQLSSLVKWGVPSKSDFTFQAVILELRLDFLDILGLLKQSAGEMRLTANIPPKYTRSRLHIRNAVKSLQSLNRRYIGAYKEFGLFICQQSRSSLRLLSVLCQFFADIAERIFFDNSTDSKKTNSDESSQIDFDSLCSTFSHPLACVIKHIYGLYIRDIMDSAVHPMVRATVIIEIMDSIFRVPCPFPRSFMAIREISRSSFKLFGDPDSMESEEHDELLEKAYDDEIEVATAVEYNLFASGKLDRNVFSKAKIQVSLIWLSCLVRYHGKFYDERMPANANNDEEIIDPGKCKRNDKVSLVVGPATALVSSDGSFFHRVDFPPLVDEGIYTVEAKIGCRDEVGEDWHLPLKSRFVRVRAKR